jgi:hypothetical protein
VLTAQRFVLDRTDRGHQQDLTSSGIAERVKVPEHQKMCFRFHPWNILPAFQSKRVFFPERFRGLRRIRYADCMGVDY